MADKSLSSEIARLSDLLSRNPGSRLFVPLAEAYLKSELIDEALAVLTEGISIHPSFVAARVMMGKILLDKEQFSEAKIQFKSVHDIAPSNIPSLKGLAEIYKEEGLIPYAKDAYRSILSIDPKDKAASDLLAILEKSAAVSPKSLERATINETETPKGPLSESSSDESFENSMADFPISKQIASEINEEKKSASVDELASSQLAWDEIDDASSVESFIREDAVSDLAPLPEAEAESGEAETLVTHTLASLYMTQGHYQEASDMYEKLLRNNLSDTESQKGLEEALARMRRASSPDSAQGRTPSQVKKVERLQVWLDAIQDKKNRSGHLSA